MPEVRNRVQHGLYCYYLKRARYVNGIRPENPRDSQSDGQNNHFRHSLLVLEAAKQWGYSLTLSVASVNISSCVHRQKAPCQRVIHDLLRCNNRDPPAICSNLRTLTVVCQPFYNLKPDSATTGKPGLVFRRTTQLLAVQKHLVTKVEKKSAANYSCAGW